MKLKKAAIGPKSTAILGCDTQGEDLIMRYLEDLGDVIFVGKKGRRAIRHSDCGANSAGKSTALRAISLDNPDVKKAYLGG